MIRKTLLALTLAALCATAAFLVKAKVDMAADTAAVEAEAAKIDTPAWEAAQAKADAALRAAKAAKAAAAAVAAAETAAFDAGNTDAADATSDAAEAADAKAAAAATAAVAAADALAGTAVSSPGPPRRHPMLTEAYARGYAMDYKGCPGHPGSASTGS